MIEGNFPNKILILGSGALRIGQAGEFDYSGSQALKALREENIQTVLINPNIASVQTDADMSDHTYCLPIEPYFIEQIIKKESIDAILLGFGGQTALNCGMALAHQGVLERYGVKVLGTSLDTIRDTEDRWRFANRLKEIDVPVARCEAAYSPDEALRAAEKIGFPVMMRSAYTLGGKGSAVVYDRDECKKQAEVAFLSGPQILIEECLLGWKEIEYEVMRDSADNCIIICNMENVDPVGIHTGDSIVVAPSQTLDDYEYQLLRDIALKTIRHLNIIGECNIQFALDKNSRRYRVIEVNARLSRSSALASKATGYPIAYIAAKIALGQTLPKIKNSVAGITNAFFEPSLDYIVCKIPRWDFSKFDQALHQIDSEMKSVGEVMAIGRSFGEALQKATRMLEVDRDGLKCDPLSVQDIKKEILYPTPQRLFVIAEALRQGITIEEIEHLSGINPFFLAEIHEIILIEQEVKKRGSLNDIDELLMHKVKRAGFSDAIIGKWFGLSECAVRDARLKLGVRPYLSQIDTLAAEHSAITNFTYFTYAATRSDVQSQTKRKIIILGSGCYRIGSSIEFDWCAVNFAKAAQELGYETILLNYNPETVSTDYDSCNLLVFDEISLETILELYHCERSEGVIIAVGGQTPNSLAMKLYEAGIKILGTSPASIDQAENRANFSELLDQLNIDQPRWTQVSFSEQLDSAVQTVGGFPVLMRPSYVLSGTSMRIVHTLSDLRHFLTKASQVSSDYPLTLSKFEEQAREIEFDAVAHDGKIILYAISEHVENAGVHSGDATLVIPSQNLSMQTLTHAHSIGGLIAQALKICGPFNIQMLVKEDHVKVIECNLRASRSLPFISKATGVNFIKVAAQAILSTPILTEIYAAHESLNYSVVRSPQFSFERLKGADPCTGVEMASTGEVACFGDDFEEALLSSLLASGFRIPEQGGVFLDIEDSYERFMFLKSCHALHSRGLKIYADSNLHTFLQNQQIPSQVSDLSLVADMFKRSKIDWVISIPTLRNSANIKSGYKLRRLAVDYHVPLTTTIQLAISIVQAIQCYQKEDINIMSVKEYRQLNTSSITANRRAI